MAPNPENLLEKLGLDIPLVGFYDTLDPLPFQPLVTPGQAGRSCMFEFYENWLNGETLHITKDDYGCPGAGSLCGAESKGDREGSVSFLVDDEGLKASYELMNQWLDDQKAYKTKHANLVIGPLRGDQYEFLKTVTFYVNPDQLSALTFGAQYYSAPTDPPPVIARFSSGCSQLVELFDDLSLPQAHIGATDVAMRQYLPPDILAFTVTKPMFEQLCGLDQDSFLYKPWWNDLRKARGQTGL